MKKLISFFLTFLLIFGLSVPSAVALFDSGTVTSKLLSEIYYLENLDEGTVFFEKNSTLQTAPAGFVKVLAAIVAIEKWNNLDGDIKITEMATVGESPFTESITVNVIINPNTPPKR